MKFFVMYFIAIIFCLSFIYGTADNHDLQNVQDGICECIDNDCGCCAHLHVEPINGRLCTNFSYLPKDIGISATITWNSRTILNKTISATNPPPLCIFYLKEVKMNVCLHFYNMNYTGCFSGCAEFEIEFFHILPFKKLQLGCFGCRSEHFSNFVFNNTDYRVEGNTNQHKKRPEVVLI